MTWDLRLGSCLEPLTGLASLADDSVDVTITDPPYDDHTHKAGRRGGMDADAAGTRGASFNRVRDLGFEAITQEDMAATAKQVGRVTRRWVLVFCTLEMVGDSAKAGGSGWRAHLERSGIEYVRTCIWHKLGSTPQFTGDRPAQAVEAIVLAHRKGRKKWNGGGRHGFYAHPIVLNRGGQNERLHTTQKPLALMDQLVADFSNPGELVLDAYAGSGTTGMACLNAGRHFLGWELSPEYHAIATRRLNGDEAKPRPEQPGLFDVRSA